MAHAPHELQKPLAKQAAAGEIAAGLAAHLHPNHAGYGNLDTAILAARYPAARGMASMGVVDPARF
jgi:hypothetical protein